MRFTKFLIPVIAALLFTLNAHAADDKFITVASTMLAIFYGFGGLADEADAEAAEAAEDGEK